MCPNALCILPTFPALSSPLLAIAWPCIGLHKPAVTDAINIKHQLIVNLSAKVTGASSITALKFYRRQLVGKLKVCCVRRVNCEVLMYDYQGDKQHNATPQSEG